MRTTKHPFLSHLLYLLLVVSPLGYSATTTGGGSGSPSTSTDGIHYVTGELLELHPDKIVTNQGTYSTTYIMVLDQRSPVNRTTSPDGLITKGKVQLKLDKDKQLLEVILY
ncbi:MAG: hypothetical protein KUG72_07515 [Pseudomonadales bacterium]|nr:hypothetical protein [Pseudomonadales bacterium]